MLSEQRAVHGVEVRVRLRAGAPRLFLQLPGRHEGSEQGRYGVSGRFGGVRAEKALRRRGKSEIFCENSVFPC